MSDDGVYNLSLIRSNMMNISVLFQQDIAPGVNRPAGLAPHPGNAALQRDMMRNVCFI